MLVDGVIDGGDYMLVDGVIDGGNCSAQEFKCVAKKLECCGWLGRRLGLGCLLAVEAAASGATVGRGTIDTTRCAATTAVVHGVKLAVCKVLHPPWQSFVRIGDTCLQRLLDGRAHAKDFARDMVA